MATSPWWLPSVAACKKWATLKVKTSRLNIVGQTVELIGSPGLWPSLFIIRLRSSTPAALAAKAETTTIPIVFESGGDPLRLGLVASLSHPGGNVTGVTQLNAVVSPRRLELLHELLPTARVMALLVNPASPTLAEIETNGALPAAHDLGVELHVLNASSERDIKKPSRSSLTWGQMGS
jgi:ABC-type uncharacterized transport system substrate-binding protein